MALTAQGLNFGGNFFDEDLNGNSLPVSWNTANITATAATLLDANPANSRATMSLRAPRTADLQMTFNANVLSANLGGPIIYTLTVKNNGADPAYSVNTQEGFPQFPTLNPTSFMWRHSPPQDQHEGGDDLPALGCFFRKVCSL